MEVFIIGEDASCAFCSEGGRFTIGASRKAEVIFEVGFDDEGNAGLKSEMLKSVVHEENGVWIVMLSQFGGFDSVMSDDEGEFSEEIPQHGGFIAPFGYI